MLIEGGHDELETAVSMLKDNNQVVVIDGSGGAANFLAALYREESKYASRNKYYESYSSIVTLQYSKYFNVLGF